MFHRSVYFSALECMGRDCEILVPEDFVLNIVTNPKIRDKYQEFSFQDFVRVSIQSFKWN